MVTGGGTGLGKAIACEFARLGASVAIVSRDADHLAAGVAAVEAEGAVAHAVACDIRDSARVGETFEEVERVLGAPGVLVNNAAGNFPVPAEDMSPNVWRAVTDIVLDGTFFCSREFGRRHLEAETPGSIINIGASYAWTGGPGHAHSAAAKAGVKSLTETLAVEWGPYGIRVNGLVPGLFPHVDEVDAIRAVPERGHNEDRRSPGAAGGAAPRARLGRGVLGIAVRDLHQRPHPRRRRRELAAPIHVAARIHAGPGAARPRAVHAHAVTPTGIKPARAAPCRRRAGGTPRRGRWASRHIEGATRRRTPRHPRSPRRWPRRG